ncbi:hypothetical protein D081_1717 [Anaerovibrio sp. JC8]|nr:hypothetical protein D081_1717 [Anaerovibrio sp. JC8]
MFAGDSYKGLPVKVYICGAIFALSILLLLFNIFVLFPRTAMEIEKEQGDLEKLGRQVDEINSFQGIHGDMEVYLANLSREYNRMEGLLPGDESIAGVVGELQTQAEASRLELILLKPGKKISHDKYGERDIELGVRGEYFSIMDFLQALQQGTRFNKTNSISIKYSPQGLECHINISIFYLIGEK